METSRVQNSKYCALPRLDPLRPDETGSFDDREDDCSHCLPAWLFDETMTEEKVALITGITGQDGSYLAELLLEKGYTVR